MGVAKVAISLEPELLMRVDALAQEIGVSRSELVRESLERTLRARDEERLVREARALYSAIESESETRRLVDAFLGAARETLPLYESGEQDRSQAAQRSQIRRGRAAPGVRSPGAKR